MKHRISGIIAILIGLLYVINPLDVPGPIDDCIVMIGSTIFSIHKFITSKNYDA